MAYRNKGFEDGDPASFAGVAEYWSLIESSSFWDFADFGLDPAGSILGFETFDPEEWLADPYITEFVGLGDDLASAIFGALGTATEEGFDSGWVTGYTDELSNPVEAWFDNDETLTAESFGGDNSVWVPGYDDDLDPIDVIEAEFGGGPDAEEGFEVDHEWLNGGASFKTAFVGVGTDLTEAVFDVAATTVENFENEW